MVPSPASPRIPGAALLVVGLLVVAVAGYAVLDLTAERHRYDVDTLEDDHEGVYTYETLSAAARSAFDDARATASNETDVDDLPTPEFASDSGSYLVRYRGTYHCIDLDPGRAPGSAVVSVEADCARLAEAGPVVHDVDALLAGARSAFLTALRAEDRSVWLSGAHPPDLDTGGDAPRLSKGRYYVRYQGTVYEFSVSGRSGLGTALAVQVMGILGVLGLLVAIVGAEAAWRERVRRPLAILAGIGVLVGLSLVRRLPGRTGSVVALAVLVGVVSAGVLWFVLAWRGLE